MNDKECNHEKTHYEDWPDGGCIEICDICGMSRYHSEFDTSEWIIVEDIPLARKEIEEALKSICESIEIIKEN